MMLKGRDILAYLSIKYNGDWDQIYAAIKNKEKIDEKQLHELLSNNQSQFYTLIDDQYPASLKNIYKPPFVLFYKGDWNLILDSKKILAIVGSRECYDQNAKITQQIITQLDNKFYIVSGIAKGIDTIAHQSIIKNNGKTIAVLGCGLNCSYPKSNAILFDEIKTAHLAISEYPDNVKPNPHHFPFRNRIISGLAWGVMIPEVKAQSGTMVTIAHAINQGKEVMVVPQSVNNGTYNNRLIYDGATLIENGKDVIDEKN